MPGRSSACRLLVVPARCSGGRIEVLVAFLNPMTGPGFSPQQVMLLQSAAAAAARRLDQDLDQQTGLLNRSGLGQVLSHLGPGVGSLVLLDIDNHHALNQAHGIAVGDAAIDKVAALMAPPLLPKRCYAARLQGGRFALLAAGLDTKSARALAAELQKAVEAIDLGADKMRIGFTASCGITAIRSLALPLELSIVAAEAALRAAKVRGRPGIEESSQDRTVFDERRDQKLVAAGLRETLRNAEIILFAQKIVSTYDTQKTTGYEVLVRMKDPFTGRILEPAQFLAAAQANNLLTAVDRHVVEAAFELLGQHRHLLAQVEVRVSINISGSSLGDPTFADFFIERLRASRLSSSQVTIDVTEKAAVVNLAVVADTLQKLRAEGCGIALDDFGLSGNALSRLQSMPVTHIKIDGSFVNEVLTNPLAESAVRSIVHFARDLKVDCVAECVETAPVLNRLRQLGVQHVQGYLVGRPAPIEEALAAMELTRSAEMSVILNF
jgi:Amt family ammonium transporter